MTSTIDRRERTTGETGASETTRTAAGGLRKWLTLALLCFAFFFYMSDRMLFGLLVIPIQKDTGLTDLQIGFIDTVLFWTIALVAPFAGMAGDRFPRTRIIAAVVLLWGVFTALTGLAGGLLGFVLLRSLGTTAVQSFYGPSSYALIASEHRRTRTIALATHQGGMYVGMLTSGAIVAALLARFGSWRSVYFVYGGLTVAVGLAFAAVFWRRRDGAGASARKSMKAGMRAFFGNPAALCAGAGFIALVFASNAFAAWAPKFVAVKFGLGVGEAGRGVMFGPNLAAMAAVIGGGFLTDMVVGRWPRFRLALQVAVLLAGVPLMALFGFTPSLTATWAALILWGIVRGLYQSNTQASVFDVVPPESRASAIGFLNVLACLIGSLAPLYVGFLSHHWGVRGFEVGFASLGLGLVVAAGAMAYSAVRLFRKWRVENE